MALTALQLVDRAYSELAIGQAPTTVIGNSNLDVTQFLNLANGLGNDLMREWDWQRLSTEYRFTTVYYQYTATVTSGSTTLSALSSTTGLTSTPTYFMVTGSGIVQDTYLVSVNSGASTAVISNAATVSGTTVTLTFGQVMYAMPSDYDRITPDTEWDKTNRWVIIGPNTGQQWQWLKSSTIATGPRARYRILGGLFQIYPAQSAALRYGMEYISNNWVIASGGTTPSKTKFTVDTDTCIYDDQLMVESLKLRFRRESGFPVGTYPAADLATGFNGRLLNIAKTADASAPKLSMSPRRSGYIIGTANIQDGYFNVTP